MKTILRISVMLVVIYSVLMGLLAVQQESMIFFPEKLPHHHVFSFDQAFEEIYIPVEGDVKLHGLLFKTDSPRGLVFYLHGNAGSLDSWGWAAETYTALGYDVFMPDYRGYGKSEGSISSEKQFYNDMQQAYNLVKARYSEDNIIVAGYSIGTAAAARLAAENKPRLLLLQAPYYSLGDLVRKLYPIVPGFLVKYKFETYKFVQKTAAPIVIFHGRQDEIIYHGSSVKLQKHFKPTDKLILLDGQGHNGMNENPDYQQKLAQILNGI